MEQRRLGRTDLDVTVAGFGAWQIGGIGNAIAHMGRSDDDESVAAIHRALDHGVNWIDTAPGYGLGHSEEVVARAVHGLDEPPYIFTKCSLVWDDTGNITVDLRPESLRAECEASLRRLRVEALDLLQIHWLDPEDDPLVEDAWATLAALKAEGKVRHIGVSNFDVGQLRRAEAIAPVETLQPPYSLVERSAEDELFPYCEQLGVGVLVYSPMQSGLLAGTFDAERVEALPETDARLFDPHFQEPLLSRNLELVERLREVARRLGATPGQVAVAWVLRHSAVDGAILGFRRPDQVDGIVVGLDRIALGEADVRELDVHGLTPP